MDKNRMNQECIDDIKAMFPPERVLIGEEISEDYGHDELGDVFSMCRLPRYLTKPRQRRNEWDMAGSDGISRVSAVFRGKSLLTNKMRII